jgi:hypothetical protein
MSHAAIAAAFGLDGVSTPERLVAFSLASYANREHRAWPSAPAAAARAGMGRGRGRSSTVLVAFAETAERLDAEINAQLFETALASSRVRGGARLLVAVMAALAGADCQVTGFSASELAAAAGLSATSYRRARGALLDSEEVRLDSGLGGRGNTNTWTLTLPDAVSSMRSTRTAPPTGARPLLATVRSTAEAHKHDAAPSAAGLEKGAASGTVSGSKGAAGKTAFDGKRARTRLTVKGRRKGRPHKPRHPTREREPNPRISEPAPPAPLAGGASPLTS